MNKQAQTYALLRYKKVFFPNDLKRNGGQRGHDGVFPTKNTKLLTAFRDAAFPSLVLIQKITAPCSKFTWNNSSEHCKRMSMRKRQARRACS